MNAISSSLIVCIFLLVVNTSVESEDEKFNGNIWAVLVAGSATYSNYRHQADVCHAYQVLKSHGIPDERIIVMMYDDIANNSLNPTPGIIINHPKGKDVYKGVPKDYIGGEVTPKNFLAVLNGDKKLESKGKKVLKSTDKDHVFIYFADHGAPGLVAFPSDELVASQLLDTLNKMYKAKTYKRLILYIEACESGSMFADILDGNKQILAITAANPEESSYACYWDDKRETYLGDEFSVAWIEESEKRHNLSSESVSQQYSYLVHATKSSHVSVYGDKSVADELLSEFQGSKVAKDDDERSISRLFTQKRDVVPAPDVPLITAKRRIELAHDPLEKAKRSAVYRAIVNARSFLEASVMSLAQKLQQHIGSNDDLVKNKLPITRRQCYEKLFKKFDSHCFDVSQHTHALRFLYILVNTCEVLPQVTDEMVDQLTDIIESHCATPDVHQSVFARII